MWSDHRVNFASLATGNPRRWATRAISKGLATAVTRSTSPDAGSRSSSAAVSARTDGSSGLSRRTREGVGLQLSVHAVLRRVGIHEVGASVRPRARASTDLRLTDPDDGVLDENARVFRRLATTSLWPLRIHGSYRLAWCAWSPVRSRA
jgi:hypothetical protein